MMMKTLVDAHCDHASNREGPCHPRRYHQLQQDSSLSSLRRLHCYHGGRNGHEGSSQMLQQGSAWQRGV